MEKKLLASYRAFSDAIHKKESIPPAAAISLALTAHTDSALEPETIRRFVESFQKTSPLSIGELWALAITLRWVLVENLRRLSVRIMADHKKRNLANQIADEIFDGIADINKFQDLTQKISSSCSEHIHTECAYFVQLANRFRDQETEIWPALEFLEKHLHKKNSSPEQADFLTRDCYRHVVERIAKKTSASQTEIAETAFQLTRAK